MHHKIKSYRSLTALALLVLFIISTGCNPTKHLKDNEYMLKSNSIDLETKAGVTQKSFLTDNLSSLIIQRPNTRILGQMPYKVWVYNLRYKKNEKDSTQFQIKSKTAEKPVVYDSTLVAKSMELMKTYLFQQGYFYADVSSSVKLKKNKKAFVTYKIETKHNYLINKTIFDIDDSVIKAIIIDAQDKTAFQQGKPFSYNLAEIERARLVEILRNKGFYKFSNDNISFVIDTLKKDYLKNIENPFESAINFITSQSEKKTQTLDITLVVRKELDSLSYTRFGIGQVYIFPDFKSGDELKTASLIKSSYQGVEFRYHDRYIKEKVIANHTFLIKGKYYAQDDYDKTISELNQLGVFESIRVVIQEDTTNKSGHWLNCYILLSPAQKYDYNANIEVSNGSTYTLGTGLTLSLRNKNLAKGANFLTLSVTGGIESLYSDTIGKSFFEHFSLLTQTFGANASLDMPKFLFPISTKRYSIRNSPRTVFGFGASTFDRVKSFRLFNLSSNFTYKWKETDTKSWEVTPAFINIIRVPYTSPEFKERLKQSEFLRNSYRQTFIEGENVTWTFSNRLRKNNGTYSYVKLALEEAGGIVSGVNLIANSFDSEFSQYLKLDFDLQQFFKQRHSNIALRFYGGIGMPYGGSSTLPYIKQYYVGGAYSMRGWAVRTLGPGLYKDTTKNPVLIDRTGDIKLELNGEYRFEIIEMFAGVMMLNGAVFADAGNIWLANPSSDYPGGEFSFNRIGNSIAINSGAGLRLDIAGFFLLRFDVAFPLKDPSLKTNTWVVNDIAFGSSKWRTKNLVLNFAIGYPF